jgi:dTDP-4-amino-4,6-dideoxygalactose transaminase
MSKTNVQSIPGVDLGRQHRAITAELEEAVAGVLRGCDFIGGHRVEQFEESFAEYCGAGHCVSMANGTDAITIALKALGVGPGDEVIVPATSFFATAEAVSNTGASVVFCDVDRETANIDAAQCARLISSKTRAIVPVHLYGQPADMTPILDLAHRHDLRVVEDCAQAVGARYRGNRVGGLGDIGCFSFYPSKNLGAAGDGGAIVTSESALATACRKLANHGGLRRYEHELVGYNSRLDALQAAILSVKLKYLDDWTRERVEIAARYRSALTSSHVEQLRVLPDVSHVYHLFVIRVAQRDEMLRGLNDVGIGAAVHYPTALPFLAPYARQAADDDFPNARYHAERTLSLPIFPFMTSAEVDRVARTVLESRTRT